MNQKLADIPFPDWEQQLTPSLGQPTPGTIINTILIYVFPLAGFLLLAYLIFGGYQYMTSMGDPKDIQAAKNHITYAIVGFIILVAAYWIVQLVGRALGITAINDIFQ